MRWPVTPIKTVRDHVYIEQNEPSMGPTLQFQCSCYNDDVMRSPRVYLRTRLLLGCLDVAPLATHVPGGGRGKATRAQRQASVTTGRQDVT